MYLFNKSHLLLKFVYLKRKELDKTKIIKRHKIITEKVITNRKN